MVVLGGGAAPSEQGTPVRVPKLNQIEESAGRSTLSRRSIQTGQIKVQTGQIKDLLDALGHLFGRLVGERHRRGEISNDVRILVYLVIYDSG